MIVWGDAVRLQQVFWNILKNASKFTPDGGRVTVVTAQSADGSRVVVEISDTGIGMTAQEMERVFEAFSQGDHATSFGSHRFGGLGLGLAISQRVVQLHHGRITAESSGRHFGALFRVELPLHRAAKPDTPPATAPPFEHMTPTTPQTTSPLGAGTRILLVEDHALTRIALEQLLVRRHYVVRSAASMAEALILAEQFTFDFLVSDIGLPDGSGYDLMKELKDRYGMRGVALTGYGMEEDVGRSQAAGFVYHLTKPIRIQSLDEALARISSPGSASPK
jgi:CheY-like chemotaxis protein